MRGLAPVEIFAKRRDGYDTNLWRALGLEQKPAAPRLATLTEETARIPCSLGAQDKDGVRLWDGREVRVDVTRSQSKGAGFCSASYIVLPYVIEYSAAGFKVRDSGGAVYDRATLRPLAQFAGNHVPGQCAQKCDRAPRDELATGVRISDAEITIATAEGPLAAAQRQR
jgi:hypothetical protein